MGSNVIGLSESAIDEKISNYLAPLKSSDLELKLSAFNIINTELLPTLAQENLPYVFNELMPCLHVTLGLVIKRIPSVILKNQNVSSNILKGIEECLRMISEVSEHVHSVLHYIIINKIDGGKILSSVPCNTLEILLELFKHCRESKDFYNDYYESISGQIITIFRKAQEINTKLKSILKNQLSFTDLSTEDEIILRRVIECLGKIGEILSKLHSKSMVETWECYISLFQNYVDNFEHCGVTIFQPLQFFSREIEQKLSYALEQDPEDLDEKNLQQTLKLIKLLIMIACKIITIVPSYVDSINFLSTIYRFNPLYIEIKNCPENVIDILKNFVFTPCDDLLQILFENEKFHECFQNTEELKPFIKENLKGFTVLLLHVILLLKRRYEDNKFVNLPFSLQKYIKVAFFIVDNADDDFYNDILNSSEYPGINNLYDVLVLNSAFVLNLMSSNEFNEAVNMLLGQILSENVGNALLATDIWMATTSYHSSENIYNLFCTLVDSSLELFSSTFCERPETVFLGNFLSKLFKKLSFNNKKEFVEKYPPQKFLTLWKYIQISDVQQSLRIRENLIRKFIEESKNLHSASTTPQDFLNLCNICEILSTTTFENMSKDVNDVKIEISKLWNMESENKEIVCDPCFLFYLESLCKITRTFLVAFNGEDIYKILQQLQKFTIYDSNIILIALPFITALSSKNLNEIKPETIVLIVNFFTKGLTSSNPVIVQESLEFFEEFFRNTSQKELAYACLSKCDVSLKIVKDFLQRNIKVDPSKVKELFEKIKSNTLVHTCIEWPENVTQKSKKLKTDNSKEIASVIERIKKDVLILENFRKVQTFSNEIVENIADVSNKLNQLSK